ncbi:MAG: DNA polymerase III subunit delta' [Vicinamibacterales bacterium]
MSFEAVTGHRRLVSLLARAVAQDRVPPALLLAGPRGVGKRRVAQALAEALNCLDPVATADGAGRDACGVCGACRKIARGMHPDVIIIEPGETGAIKIEQVRDVIDRAQYRPFEGRRRVVIVDEADAMVAQAQNALLKTLEEPPSASVFVLVSSVPDSLLETVRSRCPRLRFAPLLPADVAAVLVRDHGYTQTDAVAAAADAGGSVGRALSAQTADVTAAREVAQALLGETARRADPQRRLDAAKLLGAAKGSPASERDQLAACLRVLSSLLRDLGLLASRADARLLANADLEADLDRLSGAWDADRSSRAYAAVDRALLALDRNANPKIVADWLVLQI